MKYIHIIFKVLLSLLLLMPMIGVFGLAPAPTREMYQNDAAFQFITLLMESGYVMWMMVVVNLLAVVSLWTRREAIAALLILPISVNILGFHLFLDHTAFVAGGVMGDVLFLLNLYFLWLHRGVYRGWVENVRA